MQKKKSANDVISPSFNQNLELWYLKVRNIFGIKIYKHVKYNVLNILAYNSGIFDNFFSKVGQSL